MEKIKDVHVFFLFLFGDLLMIASIILWLTNASDGSIIYSFFIIGTVICLITIIVLTIRNKKHNISD